MMKFGALCSIVRKKNLKNALEIIILNNNTDKRGGICGILITFARKNQNRKKMRRIIAPLLIILFATTSLMSCLKDNDDKYTYYSDTGITAFSVTNIMVKKTTKSSQGTDSVYKVRQSASSYSFKIDQNSREIYNPDSLPYGTDGTKVLVSVTTENAGVAGLKALIGTDVTTITSSDSLDFSVPRTIVVRSSDGNYLREYTVKVNIHQQKGEDFNWAKLGTNAELADFKALRTFNIGGKIVAFGTDGSATTAVQTDVKDGSSWVGVTFNFNGLLPADMYQHIVKKGNRLYMIYNNKLMSSENGASWSVDGDVTVKQLVAASTDKLYATDDNGAIFSSNDGSTWNADEMDTDVTLMPTTDYNYACSMLRTNQDVERVMIVGNRDASVYAADTTAVIWSKLDDTGSYAVNFPWAYYTFDIMSKYVLPRLSNLSMTSCGEYLLVVGGKGIGECTKEAYSQIYSSLDGGLTWQDEAGFQLPDEIDKNATMMSLVTDDTYHLWIVCGGTGQIWRGRLNSMGWIADE